MSERRLGAPSDGLEGGSSNPARDSGAVAYIVAMVGAAKQRLMATHGAVLETERRTRNWDVREPFLARRGLALRQAARRAFAIELANTKQTLEELARTLRGRRQSGQGIRGPSRAFVGAETTQQVGLTAEGWAPPLPHVRPQISVPAEPIPQEAIVEARRQLRALHQLFGGNELPLGVLLGELEGTFLS